LNRSKDDKFRSAVSLIHNAQYTVTIIAVLLSLRLARVWSRRKKHRANSGSQYGKAFIMLGSAVRAVDNAQAAVFAAVDSRADSSMHRKKAPTWNRSIVPSTRYARLETAHSGPR
jgi:hypothetical protein